MNLGREAKWYFSHHNLFLKFWLKLRTLLAHVPFFIQDGYQNKVDSTYIYDF